MVPQRNGDAGNPEQGPFERPGHRSRIGDVVAEIPSFVDARHDEVRQPLEDVGDGDVHAVGRRPVDRKDALADRLEPEWMAQGERVADGARFEHGGHRRHVADLPQREC